MYFYWFIYSNEHLLLLFSVVQCPPGKSAMSTLAQNSDSRHRSIPRKRRDSPLLRRCSYPVAKQGTLLRASTLQTMDAAVLCTYCSLQTSCSVRFAGDDSRSRQHASAKSTSAANLVSLKHRRLASSSSSIIPMECSYINNNSHRKHYNNSVLEIFNQFSPRCYMERPTSSSCSRCEYPVRLGCVVDNSNLQSDLFSNNSSLCHLGNSSPSSTSHSFGTDVQTTRVVNSVSYRVSSPIAINSSNNNNSSNDNNSDLNCVTTHHSPVHLTVSSPSHRAPQVGSFGSSLGLSSVCCSSEDRRSESTCLLAGTTIVRSQIKQSTSRGTCRRRSAATCKTRDKSRDGLGSEGLAKPALRLLQEMTPALCLQKIAFSHALPLLISVLLLLSSLPSVVGEYCQINFYLYFIAAPRLT